MQRKIVIVGLCALLVLAGLTSCGKRGDPYRPSEISAQLTNSWLVSATKMCPA